MVAHLDPGRRAALFDELANLGALMTGADPAAFASVGSGADVFNVEAGQISRRT